MKKTSNLLITVLITISLGLLAGMLFAPESGKRIRKRLMKKARKLNDNIQDLAYSSSETLKDVKESLIDFTDTAGHTFEKLLKKR